MTQYKLRKGIENFQVVDGAFAGRKFVRGKVYGEVPPEEKKKFDEIKPEIPGSTGTSRKEESGKRKEEIEIPGNTPGIPEQAGINCGHGGEKYGKISCVLCVV